MSEREKEANIKQGKKVRPWYVWVCQRQDMDHPRRKCGMKIEGWSLGIVEVNVDRHLNHHDRVADLIITTGKKE